MFQLARVDGRVDGQRWAKTATKSQLEVAYELLLAGTFDDKWLGWIDVGTAFPSS